jgi:hypothetical protein
LIVCLLVSSHVNLSDYLTGPCPPPHAIGSIQIDEAFQQEVEKRLNLIPRDVGIPCILKCAAEDIVKGIFQDIKEEFGTSKIKLLKEFSFHVPGLPNDFTDTKAMIEKGRMIFKK